MLHWPLDDVILLHLLYLLSVVVIGLLLLADSLHDQRLLTSACRGALNRPADVSESELWSLRDLNRL